MSNKIIFEAPFNSLSFGQVSFNLLKELYKKQMEIILVANGNKIDLSCYDIEPNFANWIKTLASKPNLYKDESFSLKLWHINGSEYSISNNQNLFTFYELNEPTEYELAILDKQAHIFVSSTYSKDVFVRSGIDKDKISVAKLGVADDVFETKKDYQTDDYIHFGLIGKWEKRKATARILNLWAKKYGNNPKFRLTCCISNNFLGKTPEENYKKMNALISNALENKFYSNINFIGYLDKNSKVNELMNSIDIDLSGASYAEGWGLPAFNMTALGKWSIVLNATSHKDWATKDNSILIEPSGMQPCYDNIFFSEGNCFNQGSIYTWEDDVFISAMEKSEKLAKTRNEKGVLLKKDFTYEKTLDIILKNAKKS